MNACSNAGIAVGSNRDSIATGRPMSYAAANRKSSSGDKVSTVPRYAHPTTVAQRIAEQLNFEKEEAIADA